MTEPNHPPFVEGELLAGKYRVERVIGEGGMGVVLAARHEALATNVAIKLLRTAALGNTDVMGRFVREARAAVSLRSEHVARVYDVGNLDDGRPYIVMERLEGKDLGDVIDDGPPLPVPTAVDYVMQACEAIAEAHAAGIIHRDLKPRNLFLTHAVHGRPLVKVLDFGISKVASPDGPQEMQLTKTTEVIGSPSYMSPEQLRSSRNVDTRTDIWALGVILYELLTGSVPFHAETITELVLVVVTEREPTIRSLRADVPEALEAIVTKCLQKRPEDRFQSVLELVQALEPHAHGDQSTVTDRVRAMSTSGSRTAPLPSTRATEALLDSSRPSRPLVSLPAAPPSSSPSLPGVVPASLPPASSRINVHGGTSVAWGETQSLADAAPAAAPVAAPPKPRGARLAIGAALLVTLAGAGLVLLRRGSQAEAPIAAATEGTVPLPPGRKDLPPIPSASVAATPAPAPAPPPSAAEPAPSALPETRKAAPTAPPKATVARPNPSPKPDDLSNIGRR